jgi:hypothetical protein
MAFNVLAVALSLPAAFFVVTGQTAAQASPQSAQLTQRGGQTLEECKDACFHMAGAYCFGGESSRDAERRIWSSYLTREQMMLVDRRISCGEGRRAVQQCEALCPR